MSKKYTTNLSFEYGTWATSVDAPIKSAKKMKDAIAADIKNVLSNGCKNKKLSQNEKPLSLSIPFFNSDFNPLCAKMKVVFDKNCKFTYTGPSDQCSTYEHEIECNGKIMVAIEWTLTIA